MHSCLGSPDWRIWRGQARAFLRGVSHSRSHRKPLAFALAAQASGASERQPKCPISRLVGEGWADSQHRFDYDPYASSDYQGKYRMGMGLSPMKQELQEDLLENLLNPSKLQDWIEIDDEYKSDIALRRRLISENKDVVIQSTPEGSAAETELLEMLATHLSLRFPEIFNLKGDGHVIENLVTGDKFDVRDPGLDPLEAASLLVQEDLCLMQPDSEGRLRFVSGAVLFPQRWSLMEKIGMDMRRIHEPVPLYQDEIGRPVAAFMDRLEVGRPFWRCNWTISDNPAKFQPLGEDAIQQVNAGVDLNGSWQGREVTAANAGETLCTRMERETISRLPRTRAILFTIRTHMKPLGRFRNRPEKAVELATALRNLHPAITQYKTIAAFRQQALDFLDACSAPVKRESATVAGMPPMRA